LNGIDGQDRAGEQKNKKSEGGLHLFLFFFFFSFKIFFLTLEKVGLAFSQARARWVRADIDPARPR
jgi:hypothetical protein